MLRFSDWPTDEQIIDLYATEFGQYALKNWWIDFINAVSDKPLVEIVNMVDASLNRTRMDVYPPRLGRGICELTEFVNDVKADFITNKEDILHNFREWLSMADDMIYE
jgi:hypothetical protein